MRKILNLFILALFICINRSNVYAFSCPNEVSKDLTQTAYYVKADYEVIDKSIYKELQIGDDKTTYKIPKYEFVISIYNITDDIYVTLFDDVYHDNITIKKENTVDGEYDFINKDFGTIYNYTITIYSNKNECYGEKIKSIKLTKPMYNAYSEYTYCKNSSNYYCQKFANTDLKLKSSEDFFTKIKVNNEAIKPEEKAETKEKETLIELLKKNWKIYIVLFISVVLVTIIIILILRKKREKKGWDI